MVLHADLEVVILTLKGVVVLHADLEEVILTLKDVVVMHADLEVATDLERGCGPAH